jgi:ABC-type spermidine/putrescine transport system permease subunit I
MSTEDETNLINGFDDGILGRINEVHFLIGPAVLWYFVFLVCPLLLVVVYSFLTYSNFSVTWEFTLNAWGDVVSDTVFDVFVTTLGMGLLTSLLALVFGYPMAYYMRFNMGQYTGMFLLIFLVIVFWTAEVIRMIAWYPILGTGGAINQALLWLGLIEEPLSWLLFSLFAQIVGYLQNYLLFMAAPIYIALFRIDEDLLSASETLRATPVETFRYVVFPQSLPGIVIGFIFVFVMSVGDFIIPQVLSGGSSTITGIIYSNVATNLNYPTASAISIVLLIVIFLILYIPTRVIDITQIYEL